MLDDLVMYDTMVSMYLDDEDKAIKKSMGGG